MTNEMTTFRLSNKHAVLKALQDLKLISGEQWSLTRLINESLVFYLMERHGIDLEEYR
jgi:hypothetical protein